MTQLLPWERSLLALIHGKSEADFTGMGILIGPIILPGLMPWPMDAIVKIALKDRNAITIDNNVWFPREIDTSTVRDLKWLVHESVHVVDYAIAGTEAFLKAYVQQAIMNGFKHDAIPLERRAIRIASAAERMLARFPDLVKAINSCDGSAVQSLLTLRKDDYVAALNESMDQEDLHESAPDDSRPDEELGTAEAGEDLKSVEAVLWAVIRIVNRQDDEKSADPDRTAINAPWFPRNKSLLKEWYLLTYGEPGASGRTKLKGDALRAKLENAFRLTRPLLGVLKTEGGSKWTEHLRTFFYPRVADLEFEAARTAAVGGRARQGVVFGEKPTTVSLGDFFRVVATQPSRPVEIARGHGGFSLGTATVGTTFSASKQDHRVLLWSNGQGVLFMRDGKVYSQLGRWFSEDVIMGAFVIAGQNALGMAILTQIMVEVALSFTPWGFVADVVFALEALTRGSWSEAALNLLPGPAMAVASKTRAFRAAGRATAATGRIVADVAKGALRFIGRGAYVLGGKRLRGLWTVSESGGKSSYRFFDDVGQTWHDVPDAAASRYIKCSKCDFTPSGKVEALEGAVDEIVDDLRHAKAYSSGGRVLVNRELIKDVVKAYGPEGEHVVESIINTWASAPNAAKHVDDTLQIAKDLSRIKGKRGYMDAIDIFDDLASSSVTTARGTMFELRWAAQHADEIEAMGIPVVRNHWVGKGLDVLKKNGEAIELKNFDFTSEFYKGDPGRTVARVMKQVESRVKYQGVKKVTVLFSSEAGKMPSAFAQQLRAAMDELATRTGWKSTDITFGLWP